MLRNILRKGGKKVEQEIREEKNMCVDGIMKQMNNGVSLEKIRVAIELAWVEGYVVGKEK